MIYGARSLLCYQSHQLGTSYKKLTSSAVLVPFMVLLTIGHASWISSLVYRKEQELKMVKVMNASILKAMPSLPLSTMHPPTTITSKSRSILQSGMRPSISNKVCQVVGPAP